MNSDQPTKPAKPDMPTKTTDNHSVREGEAPSVDTHQQATAADNHETDALKKPLGRVFNLRAFACAEDIKSTSDESVTVDDADTKGDYVWDEDDWIEDDWEEADEEDEALEKEYDCEGNEIPTKRDIEELDGDEAYFYEFHGIVPQSFQKRFPHLMDRCTSFWDEFDEWDDEETPSEPVHAVTLEALDASPRGLVVFHDIQAGENKESEKKLKPFVELLGQTLPSATVRPVEQWLNMIQRDLPWLASAAEAIGRQIRLSALNSSDGFSLARPILLVGQPGIGKSWLTQRLAEEMGLPSFTIAAAGKQDNMALKGSARGWHSSRPSELVQFIANHKCPNPLVIVDEIEKASKESRNGSFLDALLQFFERENSAHWRDDFLLGRVDLSQVSWIATANKDIALPEPMRSRMEIIRLKAPETPEEKRLMLKSAAISVAKRYGLDWSSEPGNLSIPLKDSPWPVFLNDEAIIEFMLAKGTNFRDYERFAVGALDRWTEQRRQRLM